MTSSAPAILTHTVNLDAIAHNVKTVKSIAGVDELMAVVKADGYSQGALQSALAALEGGATQLGVATLEEAISLRAKLCAALDDGRTIPILAWIWDAAATWLIERAVADNIDLGVPSMAHAQAVVGAGRELSVTPRVTVMVDTGLGRSGFSMANGDFDRAVEPLAALHKEGALRITGAFTHFACADEPGNESVDRQAENFRTALSALREAGVAEMINHAANSPAALTRPDLAFDMVRPGLAIYGGEPIAGMTHGLRPAMRWEASVVLVKKLPAGESVSYGLTWTADRDTTVGIVPCGYADGMMRSASGRFEVSIDGKRYPQVGRICMDQFVVDLGPDTDVVPGDTAVIVGDPALGEPGLDEMAEAFGTINYEILTAPKGRSQRRYVHSRVVPTAEDMRELGEQIGRMLSSGELVILDGPLGAGKTTLTQGIARGMEVRGRVTSPTFTIAREHRPLASDGATLIHVDAYRLFGEEGPGSQGDAFDALDSLDLDTDLQDSVVVAEWGAGLAEVLSDRYLLVSIDRSRTDDARVVTWQWVK
ncbi:MAG: alanine racemase [Corynebacterium sp.]|uniref:alanine racemase n=1 Tax=Corynebacterium sp. TaxID=1720 RepID=UPI0026DB0FC1|nr:alanine racemase [Corynebacterium sp.]MDO5030097.1 alanine racemase [Corynebacterium sp.]